MRPAALAGLVIALLAAHAVATEPAAYRAVVSDAEVKLRAGPSDTYPETGMLKQGSVVVVEREESNGWLAVTAPHGSVSWIAAAFVEDLAPEKDSPKNGYVHTEGEVTLAAGKAGLAQPLEVRREKVPQGTAVLILGPKVDFGGKKWYPIAPPPGDVRYLPKTAVRLDAPLNNSFAVRVSDTGGPATNPAPAGGPLATIPGPGTTTPAGGVTAGKPAVNHPLWAQAEAAERDGRLADAEKAYFDLAALMNGQGGDHDIANLCYTRIHALREKKRTAGGTPNTGSTVGSGAKAPSVLQPPKEDRVVRPGAPQAIPPGTGTGGNASANDPRPAWTGIGTLRRSVLTPDGTGRPAYALETSPGVVKCYVVAAPGVELEKYLGKKVDVYGTQQTRGGLSKPYVIATSVEAP